MGLISTAPASESVYVLDTGWKKSNHVAGTQTYHEEDLVLPKSAGFSYLLFDYQTTDTHNAQTLQAEVTRPDGFANEITYSWYRSPSVSENTSDNMIPRYPTAATGTTTLGQTFIHRAGNSSYRMENHELPTFRITPLYQASFSFWTSPSLNVSFALYYRIRIITEDNARRFSL
jgi:hypothetical protein